MLRPHVLYLRQHWMLLLTRDGLYKCVCEAIVRPEPSWHIYYTLYTLAECIQCIHSVYTPQECVYTVYTLIYTANTP